MGKGIRRAVMAAALVLFLFSIISMGNILYNRGRDEALYREAQESYTAFVGESGETKTETGKSATEHNGVSGEGSSGGPGEKAYGDSEAGKERAPLVVDFAKLQAENEEVQGWIYCEGTPINYPVVKGEDNSFYLNHSYDGKESASGAIFMDVSNRSGFADANSILYGHHMKNGSMFAGLEKWADQEYYEEHPQMWLLTPEGDYRIVLFAGYTTRSDSETYTIFTDFCPEMEEYLKKCMEKSDFRADLEKAGQKFVVLSTCAYSFEEARYVLHGILVPVEAREQEINF